MFRLLVATLVAAAALQASSFTFSSCTAGTTTVSPCGGDVFTFNGIYGPDYEALGGTGASDNSNIFGPADLGGLPIIPSGYEISVGAGAVASSSGPNPKLSAIAQASASKAFYSAGSPRLGFIQFDVSLSHLHGGDSNVFISDGTHNYGYDAELCGFEGCQVTATVPFDLGSGFQVSTSAGVKEFLEPTSDPCCGGGSAHGYDDALIVFRLLESDGATPVPFSATPEPATWALLLFGLGATWLAGTKRRRTH